MYPFTAGLLIATKQLWDEVHETLQEASVRVVMEQPQIADWAAFLDKLERVRPDLLLVDLVQLREPLADVVRRLKAISPPPLVIALHTSAEPDLILEALRAGANEYVYSPLQASLRKALERLSSERVAQTAGQRRGGQTVAFLSAKGGCGATTLSCHFALEVAHHTNQPALLVDFDLHSGLVGFLMKSKSKYSVLDALRNLHRLDTSFLKGIVSNGYSGLEVLSAPQSPGCHEDPKPQELRHVLKFLRTCYAWTVVDLGRGLPPGNLHALEEIDTVYLVTTVEVPALHNAQQIVQSLFNSGFPKSRLRVVVNRYSRRSDVTPEEIEKMLGAGVVASVPNDYGALYEAYVQGKLLQPASHIAKSLRTLAARLVGVQEEKKKFSLFG